MSAASLATSTAPSTEIPNVGRVQRRGVVDAVSHVSDHVAGLLQGDDQPLLLIGLHLGEDGHAIHALEQRLVAHPVELRTGENLRARQSHLLRRVERDQVVVSGDHLERNAEAIELAYRVHDPRLRRIEEHQEAQEGHLGLVVPGGLRVRPDIPVRHTQRTQPLSAELRESLIDRVPHGDDVLLRASGRLRGRADCQHILQGALCHQQAPVALGDQDAQSLTDEVVGKLVQLLVARHIEATMGADRLVDGIHESGLVERVEVGVEQHLLALLALHVERGTQAYDSLGESARLVGTQHVHAAEVLDRREAPHDHLRARHALGAVSEVDADDRRQQLRSQPDGQRHGEEEGLQHGTLQVDVDGEDGDDQHQRHLHQEVAKTPDAALEVGFGGPELEPLGDLAKLRCAARADDQGLGVAAHHVGSHEERVRPLTESRLGRQRRCGFRDRIGLTRQCRFVDEQVLGLQDQAVARQIAPR
jgi:hypothetical protein